MAYIGKVEIVRTRRFSKDLDRIGASEDDVRRLEDEIAQNPLAGDLIVGLRGLRKLRFRIGNRGKSGGGRAIYYVQVARGVVLLIFAYGKAEQADLTPAQRKAVLALLEELDDGEA